MAGMAENWRKLSGENNWEDLLDPLDITLRRYIIHYGERTEAVSDAYNGETQSNRFPLYAPEHFFSKVGLQNNNAMKYQVTNYFYARAEFDIFGWVFAEESSWMGYVAVATDEGKSALGRRDILICWRGTRTGMEWAKDIDITQVSASDLLGVGTAENPKVHRGFFTLYTNKGSDSVYNKTSAREQVLNEVRKLVDKYQDEEISITVTGHSLGGALATLNGMDIAANGYNKPKNQPSKACPVTVMSFAGPRVGNKCFKKVCSKLNDLHILHIANTRDLVPFIPRLWFADVGEKLLIDSKDSPYLDANANAHNLELYLHVIAGTHGSSEKFKLVVDRSISLVNKSSSALKEKYNIPKEWWVEKNKNMVQLADGSWVLEDYVPDPPSTPEELIPL